MPPLNLEYQIAAVPMRLNEHRRVEVCLITSRETARWIIPKGWPMKGLRDDIAAGIEAEEEAGVKGSTMRAPLGSYTYWRRTRTHFRETPVTTYLLRVKRQKKRWKEQLERTVEWVPLLEAADRVLEPELSTLLINIPGNVDACSFVGKGDQIAF